VLQLVGTRSVWTGIVPLDLTSMSGRSSVLLSFEVITFISVAISYCLDMRTADDPFGLGVLKFNLHYINFLLNEWSTKLNVD
jgi:hypothetical protein